MNTRYWAAKIVRSEGTGTSELWVRVLGLIERARGGVEEAEDSSGQKHGHDADEHRRYMSRASSQGAIARPSEALATSRWGSATLIVIARPTEIGDECVPRSHDTLPPRPPSTKIVLRPPRRVIDETVPWMNSVKRLYVV